METKSTPPTVVISIVVLLLIAICGIANVSFGLGYWRVFHNEFIPFQLLGRALMFCFAPVLAIAGIVRLRPFGRYLAILSFVCAWAAVLRGLSSIPTQLFNRADSILLIPIFGIVIWLPVLVYFLGFNKRVNAYFGSELHT